MADFNIAPYEALAMGCNVVWTTEMETEPAIEASGRVFVSVPEDGPFARAIIDAMRASRDAHVDLHGMTWDGRARKLDTIYRSVTGEAVAA